MASDERQARIIFNTARRMVELNDELADRIHVYADRLHEPRTDSTFMALPADPGSLQGRDPSLAIVDELHVVTDDTFEAMAARAGKRDRSLLLAISTPPKTGQDDSVMRRLVDHGRDGGDRRASSGSSPPRPAARSTTSRHGRRQIPHCTTSCTPTPCGRPCRPSCARTHSGATGSARGRRGR